MTSIEFFPVLCKTRKSQPTLMRQWTRPVLSQDNLCHARKSAGKTLLWTCSTRLTKRSEEFPPNDVDTMHVINRPVEDCSVYKIRTWNRV